MSRGVDEGRWRCAPYAIPISSPFDSVVERTTHELGDLCFINKRGTNPITQLGYTGPGWYHRIMGEHLLHYGIITWENIGFSFLPQATCQQASSTSRCR